MHGVGDTYTHGDNIIPFLFENKCFSLAEYIHVIDCFVQVSKCTLTHAHTYTHITSQTQTYKQTYTHKYTHTYAA